MLPQGNRLHFRPCPGDVAERSKERQPAGPMEMGYLIILKK
jgi:hypothetical protein